MTAGVRSQESEVRIETRNSKSENRNSNTAALHVTAAKAGVHKIVDLRFRGGDCKLSGFRFSPSF